jgi:hypothetical protein
LPLSISEKRDVKLPSLATQGDGATKQNSPGYEVQDEEKRGERERFR